MRSIISLAILCLSFAASAEGSARFDKLRAGAQTLSALGPFLEKYVGECPDLASRAECKANAAAFRRESNGQRFYMLLGEDSATMLAAGRSDSRKNEITLNITPFFPAGPYALTLGAPGRTDASGNPVMPLVYVRAQIPEGQTDASVARLVATRALRLQVVFSPQEVWTLSKKGGGKILGVRAKIEAMRISIGRSGDELAVWTG